MSEELKKKHDLIESITDNLDALNHNVQSVKNAISPSSEKGEEISINEYDDIIASYYKMLISIIKSMKALSKYMFKKEGVETILRVFLDVLHNERIKNIKTVDS